MSRRLTRLLLLPLLFVAGQALALGLGDIRLQSALNEPLRAEIDLLAAAPEELTNLTVRLASAETFERYGLDRPFFLVDMACDVVACVEVSVVVDNHHDFEIELVKLLKDKEKKDFLADKGRKWVVETLDWSVIAPDILDFVER